VFGTGSGSAVVSENVSRVKTNISLVRRGI